MASQDIHIAVYEDADSDQWVAVCLEYNVMSQGDSEEHALDMIREAVELYLDDLGEAGRELLFQAMVGEPRLHKIAVNAQTLLRS